jgi:hypothetical protein
VTEPSDTSKSSSVNRLLGLHLDTIGIVSIEEIVGNAAAIRMLVRQNVDLEQLAGQLRATVERQEVDLNKHGENALLRDANAALEQQLRVYEGYQRAYAEKKWAARLGAILQLLSSVAVGVGVNLSTPTISVGGLALIAIGTSIALAGIYVAYKA